MNDLQKTEYLLQPGYLIVPGEPMLIYMILGSCVSVIIFNRKQQKSGCCHFMVPQVTGDDSPKPKHGTAAILALIRMLLEHGGARDDLEAQVIGGSDLPGRTLGKENVEIAVKVLTKKGIHITSVDTGGDKARKVIYNTESNHVAIIKVEKIRSSDWYP